MVPFGGYVWDNRVRTSHHTLSSNMFHSAVLSGCAVRLRPVRPVAQNEIRRVQCSSTIPDMVFPDMVPCPCGEAKIQLRLLPPRNSDCHVRRLRCSGWIVRRPRLEHPLHVRTGSMKGTQDRLTWQPSRLTGLEIASYACPHHKPSRWPWSKRPVPYQKAAPDAMAHHAGTLATMRCAPRHGG